MARRPGCLTPLCLVVTALCSVVLVIHRNQCCWFAGSSGGNKCVLQQPACGRHQTAVSWKVRGPPQAPLLFGESCSNESSQNQKPEPLFIKVFLGLLGMLIQETARARTQINPRQGWFNMPEKWWKQGVLSPSLTVIPQSHMMHTKTSSAGLPDASSSLCSETKTGRCLCLYNDKALCVLK